ncbi:MAG: hypothetical protein ACOCV1_03680 [Bacillota bacterium]
MFDKNLFSINKQIKREKSFAPIDLWNFIKNEQIDFIKPIYLEIYRNYLLNPRNEFYKELFLLFLLKTKKIASIWTEDCYNIWKNTKKISGNYEILKSNGSIDSNKKEYKWGPNFQEIRDVLFCCNHDIESLENIKRYWIIPALKTNLGFNIQNEGVNTNLGPDFQEYSDNFNSSIWILNGVNFNIILKYKNIIPFIKENNITISLTEMDYSAYNFNDIDNIKIIDQMRNWKEGTSFYTCEYNIKHWMENVFYCSSNKKIIDLLNFQSQYDSKDNSDKIFPIEKQFKQCKCGQFYREMNFEPHYIKWFSDYRGLPCSFNFSEDFYFIKDYDYFQIIQEKEMENFRIHSYPAVSTADLFAVKKMLLKAYKSPRFNVKTTIGRYYVNNKIPVFWSETN